MYEIVKLNDKGQWWIPSTKQHLERKYIVMKEYNNNLLYVLYPPHYATNHTGFLILTKDEIVYV